MTISSINVSNLKSLTECISVILAGIFLVYSSFHATLYDDAKKKINNKYDSYRSIHSSPGHRFSLGLPIPILSKSENEEIEKYKKTYNRIILKFWVMVVLAIVTFNI